jgi:hypothetical protein
MSGFKSNKSVSREFTNELFPLPLIVPLQFSLPAVTFRISTPQGHYNWVTTITVCGLDYIFM